MSDATPAPGVPTCYRHPGRETHIRCQRCDRPICPDCMVSASVGFQCPDCVREGNENVRQARTTYGGLIPSGRSIAVVIVIINVVVWGLIQLTGGNGSSLVPWLAMLPKGFCEIPGESLIGINQQVCDVNGLDWYPGVADGAVWRMITSVFVQVGLTHLFFNVLNVWILGSQLEAVFGKARFLAIYLLSGFAGSVAVYWFGYEHGLTVGASGAVFGLLGALLIVVLKTRQAPQGMLIWIAISVAYSFAVPGISWQAHLGGLVGGAVIAAAIVWAPRGPKRATYQWGAVVAMGVLLAALTVLRTAVLNA